MACAFFAPELGIWVSSPEIFNFDFILGQCFDHSLAFGERSRRISGISLHIISVRIFLDGSGLSMQPWPGHSLLPSCENGCQVGKVGNGLKEKKF